MSEERNFVIIVDTTADLDRKYLTEYDIEMIPGHIVIDGIDHESTTDWEKFPYTREEFYAALKANPARFSTSPPSVGVLANRFIELADEGKAVLAVTMSGGLSGTYRFYEQAKQMALESRPAAQILCVDSRRFGPAVGQMAVHAAELRAAGRSFAETAAELEANKNRYHQAGWLDDLSFVAKSGRITPTKAFFGTLIGIKPIGEFDENGMTTPLGNAKGEKKALEVLIGYVKKTIENPEEQVIFVAQSNRLKQAEVYKALLEKELHPKAVIIKDVYPSSGTNVGPGLMAAYYRGSEITKGLQTERAIIESLLNA